MVAIQFNQPEAVLLPQSSGWDNGLARRARGALFLFLALLAMVSTSSFAMSEARTKALRLGAVLFVWGETDWWTVASYVTAYLWQMPEGKLYVAIVCSVL